MQIKIPEDKKEIAINYIRRVLEELDREIEKNEKEAAGNGKEQERTASDE